MKVRSVLYILLSLWLFGLSALAFLNHLGLRELAEQDTFDAAQRQLQSLEVRFNELSEGLSEIRTQPETVTIAALQSTRQTLEERIAQLEQTSSTKAMEETMAALRNEVEELRSHIKSMQTVASATPAPAQKITPAAKRPFPFRILGAELRAGQRTVSVAPLTGARSTEQIQVLLPGETVGQWRLERIDGNTAIFRAGKETRRVSVPQ